MTSTARDTAEKPRRLSWLRPPKGTPDGTMALVDHLRELRYRVTVGVGAILLCSILSGFFYRQLVAIVTKPFFEASQVIKAANDQADLEIVTDGVISPFTLAIIACIVGGVMISSPIWLYQIWAFIAPGLLRNEKKYALSFIGAAAPLFLLGCLVGYWILPRGIAIMLGFTPRGVEITNLLEISRFLKFELQIVFIFGLSFLLPVVVIALNLMNVVRGYQLGQARKIVIFLTFVFAAMVTPTVDPFSLLALSGPMTLLYLVAEIICRILDKRKGITEQTAAEFAIDLNDGK